VNSKEDGIRVRSDFGQGHGTAMPQQVGKTDRQRIDTRFSSTAISDTSAVRQPERGSFKVVLVRIGAGSEKIY